MTEAVKGFTSWVKNLGYIKSIIASTEKPNIASYRILEKNGFVNTGQTEDLIHWALKIN